MKKIILSLAISISSHLIAEDLKPSYLETLTDLSLLEFSTKPSPLMRHILFFAKNGKLTCLPKLFERLIF